MSLILNIDTALEQASVCLADGANVISMEGNGAQKDHASWVHPAIARLLEMNGKKMADLSAVAVSIGPGSYTGLRVGLATAKGICYAAGLPLITVPTLKVIAVSALSEATDWICPLIDARRMEVFSAFYGKTLSEIRSANAEVLDEKSYTAELSTHKILFCGNGMQKLQNMLSHPNASFSTAKPSAAHLARLSADEYLQKNFADLAYSAPLYIKDFYFPNAGK